MWLAYAIKENFSGKPVKTVTINLSVSDLQSTGTSTTQIDLSNYISPDINVIKIEGYYLPPSDCPSLYKDKKFIIYTSHTDQIGVIRHNGSKWVMNIAQSSSGSNKGSGFAKIYYVE